MHKLAKIGNFQTNANLKKERGSWKEWLLKSKDKDLRLSRNGCSRKIYMECKNLDIFFMERQKKNFKNTLKECKF